MKNTEFEENINKRQEKGLSIDTIVGTFQYNKNFGFVIPDDKSLGTDIFIPKSGFGRARNNHKVLVKITKYPKKGKKAEGRVIEVIGGINQAGVDMLSIIKEYGLPAEFPKNVLEEAKKVKRKIEKKDIPYRKDKRDDIIFTIDGEDAKDLDDAVRVLKLENGNYMLDVHIADVSNYVKENSLLDQEALVRGTSVYMLGRVIPMLPRELSNGICSLNAGEDRLTLSCSMEIDSNGNVINSEIYKGIINVKERMNYNDVQKILDKSDKVVIERYKNYIQDFELMAELAQILKEKRAQNGYLNLDIPESEIVLDLDGNTIDVKKYETSFANEIIEQFMLIANETIAEKFYWLEAPFIYRVHEEPDIDKVKELNKFLYNFGLKVKITQDKVYPKEFAKILEKIKGKKEERVVSTLVLRTMKVARYESENKGHFGIAGKYYCHFTSPIRRYPDLFIHRIVSKYIEENYAVNDDYIEEHIIQAEKRATQSSKREKVATKAERDAEKLKKAEYMKQKIGEENYAVNDDYIEEHIIQAEKRAKQSSEREKVATKAEREAEKLKKAEYMKQKIGEEYEGIISSVTQFGIFVELENTVEGLVRFENLGNEYYEYNENIKVLIGENTRETFKIGDKIKIRVINASKELKQVDFERII